MERHAAGGNQRLLQAVPMQVSRLALRLGRPPDPRTAGGLILRPGQEPLRAGAGALRRVARLHLRELRRRAPAIAAGFPGPDGSRLGRLSVRTDDVSVVLPLRSEGELEALPGRVSGVLSRAGVAREPVADQILESGGGSRF